MWWRGGLFWKIMLKKVIREKDKEKLDMNVFKELGKDLNYKDSIITKYVNMETGKILPRRFTGTCAKHQRCVAKEVKRARFMGFIPYCK